MLVSVLPETSEKPLPETLDDAVTFLRTEQKACYGWGLSGPLTRSISLHEQPSGEENNTPAQEKDDLVDNIATGRRRYPAGNQRRMISPHTQVSLPRNESRNDSILQDIADLSIPDRLPEAFGEDH
ncbi:hypothetical protein OESDEN_16521 [Oesophagostomum dentatum]|uniref:Uncharacterized protein n=1 Tax=Oesophagostomum dentatum TaxID=61180 RepID=A0A0B1SIR4_OESDE|nr:hypothetical protein OESDEN_16521 [Oesophagostomum dentatum]